MGLWSSVKKAANKAQKTASRVVTATHVEALADVASMTGDNGLLTNPKGYAGAVKSGIVTDVKTGARVMKQFGSGQWGALASEAAYDIGTVAGASSATKARMSAFGRKAGDTYEKADQYAGAIEAARTGDYRGTVAELATTGGTVGALARQANAGAELYDQGAAIAEAGANVNFGNLSSAVGGYTSDLKNLNAKASALASSAKGLSSKAQSALASFPGMSNATRTRAEAALNAAGKASTQASNSPTVAEAANATGLPRWAILAAAAVGLFVLLRR